MIYMIAGKIFNSKVEKKFKLLPKGSKDNKN
jgi:hypothetical protein